MGVGVGMYPYSWFTRSGFGGRFSTMLKYAGWDAIVIEGRADTPVWVDIRNGNVEFRDAARLWGKDTWATQQEIWEHVGVERGTPAPPGRTSTVRRGGDDRPSGPGTHDPEAGGPLHRPGRGEPDLPGRLIHDAGNGAGQGGFGAVWGSKNLKAISVIGTGAIPVADPEALIKARLVTKEKYVTDFDQPDFGAWTRVGGLPKPIIQVPPPTQ